MATRSTPNRRFTFPAAAGFAAALMLAAAPAVADPPGHRGAPPFAAKGPHATPAGRKDEHWPGWKERRYRTTIVHDRVIYVPPKRVRHYRNVIVVRPYGHWYPGFAHYRRDRDAYRWLALTAITVSLINNLTEHQQRSYEAAQVRATAAPVGEVIAWTNGAARGTVVAVREGTSSLGRYCREFQQTVTIGGRTEEAYGTACRQPDGAWEVVSAGQ